MALDPRTLAGMMPYDENGKWLDLGGQMRALSGQTGEAADLYRRQANNYYNAGGAGHSTSWDINYQAVAQNPKPYIDAGIAKANGDGTFTLLKVQDPETQQWVPAEVAAQQPWGKPSKEFAFTPPSGGGGPMAKSATTTEPADGSGTVGGIQGLAGGAPTSGGAGTSPIAGGTGAAGGAANTIPGRTRPGSEQGPPGAGVGGLGGLWANAGPPPTQTGRPGLGGMGSWGGGGLNPNPGRTRAGGGGLDLASILQRLLSYRAGSNGNNPGGGVQTPPPTNPPNPANYTGYPMRAFDPSWLIRGMRSHFQGKSGAGVPYEVPTMNKGWQGNNINNWFSIYGRG